MTNQTGYTAQGDVNNTAGDRIEINVFGPDFGYQDGEDYEESSHSAISNGSVATAGGGIGAFAVIALAVVAYMVFGGSEPFPTESDPWPPDVKQDAVVAAVADWFDRCQRSTSAAPLNCPQSITGELSVSSVLWTFLGNPLDHPIIRYSKDEGGFDILGTAVVLAEYTISGSPNRTVTLMKYWAKVSWTDGKLDVQKIDKHSHPNDPEIVKQDPKQAWEPMEANLKYAFAQCVSDTGPTMPSGCPEWKLSPGATEVKWSVAGDPTLTARPYFDKEFGIYRISGTFALHVRYKLIGEAKMENRNINYEALIAPSSDGPIVLQIKESL
jgi:hypothetical protein